MDSSESLEENLKRAREVRRGPEAEGHLMKQLRDIFWTLRIFFLCPFTLPCLPPSRFRPLNFRLAKCWPRLNILCLLVTACYVGQVVNETFRSLFDLFGLLVGLKMGLFSFKVSMRLVMIFSTLHGAVCIYFFLVRSREWHNILARMDLVMSHYKIHIGWGIRLISVFAVGITIIGVYSRLLAKVIIVERNPEVQRGYIIATNIVILLLPSVLLLWISEVVVQASKQNADRFRQLLAPGFVLWDELHSGPRRIILAVLRLISPLGTALLIQFGLGHLIP